MSGKLCSFVAWQKFQPVCACRGRGINGSCATSVWINGKWIVLNVIYFLIWWFMSIALELCFGIFGLIASNISSFQRSFSSACHCYLAVNVSNFIYFVVNHLLAPFESFKRSALKLEIESPGAIALPIYTIFRFFYSKVTTKTTTVSLAAFPTGSSGDSFPVVWLHTSSEDVYRQTHNTPGWKHEQYNVQKLHGG